MCKKKTFCPSFSWENNLEMMALGKSRKNWGKRGIDFAASWSLLLLVGGGESWVWRLWRKFFLAAGSSSILPPEIDFPEKRRGCLFLLFCGKVREEGTFSSSSSWKAALVIDPRMERKMMAWWFKTLFLKGHRVEKVMSNSFPPCVHFIHGW